MNYPGGFKLEFGSPVTVLTTAATGSSHGRHRSQGIFTGVVLAESPLDFKRGKHISISFAGMNEEPSEYESDYGAYEDCKESETEETETTEYQKPFKKKEEEFLVMALTHPSCPYVAGQIVWINVAEIVSIGAVCTSPVRR